MAAPVFNRGLYLMGIVNVTPDSFSDGGCFSDPQKAIDHALRLADEGAHILDIGGESTKPGVQPVTVQEELDRVLPVIEGLRGCGKIISIDTRNAATMQAAVAAGATLINDVTALRGDPDSIKIAAACDAAICLMHMQGEPQTMQKNPHYDDVFAEVFSFLEQRIEVCVEAGIARERLIVDPGIGFGKTLTHNLDLLKRLGDFQALQVPVLLGLSRKSFIEKLCPQTPATARLPGSLAGALWGLVQGVQILRVHDVAETRQACTVFNAICNA